MPKVNQSLIIQKLGTMLHFLLDLLFPRSEAEIALDALSSDIILQRSRPAEPIGNKDCFAVLSYRDPLARGLISSLKYHHNKKAALICGELLHQAIIDQMDESAAFINFGRPILVAMPLAPKRLKERGYNQSELIVRRITELDDGKIFESSNGRILIKIKETLPQTLLRDRAARLSNLKGCFMVANKGAIQGKTIILIDDVITTGATMRSARRTLLKAGARRILCFAVAH
jgi:ComF family protein